MGTDCYYLDYTLNGHNDLKFKFFNFKAKRYKRMYYFDIIPQELTHVILYNIDEINVIKNLYK